MSSDPTIASTEQEAQNDGPLNGYVNDLIIGGSNRRAVLKELEEFGEPQDDRVTVYGIVQRLIKLIDQLGAARFAGSESLPSGAGSVDAKSGLSGNVYVERDEASGDLVAHVVPDDIDALLNNFQRACEAVVVRGDSSLSATTKERAILRNELRARLLSRPSLGVRPEPETAVPDGYGVAHARWREAASAPKTGEHILVASFLGRGFGICGGKWQDWCAVVHYWDVPGEEGFYLSAGNDDNPVEFSHWIELPSASPAAAAPVSASSETDEI